MITSKAIFAILNQRLFKSWFYMFLIFYKIKSIIDNLNNIDKTNLKINDWEFSISYLCDCSYGSFESLGDLFNLGRVIQTRRIENEMDILKPQFNLSVVSPKNIIYLFYQVFFFNILLLFTF